MFFSSLTQGSEKQKTNLSVYKQHEITEITLQKSVTEKSGHWTNDGLTL